MLFPGLHPYKVLTREVSERYRLRGVTLAEPRSRISREERRHCLLTSARDLFGEHGYRGAEVDQIAHDAGVTKPMLYRHFPGGKPEIFLAVLEEHMDCLMRALRDARASSGEPGMRLRNGLDAYLKFAEGNSAGFRLLNSSAGIDPAVGVRLREVRELIAGGLSNTISDVMNGAGLSAQGAPLYAHALLGGVESVTAWWLDAGKQPERAVIVDHLLAFVRRGFEGMPALSQK